MFALAHVSTRRVLLFRVRRTWLGLVERLELPDGKPIRLGLEAHRTGPPRDLGLLGIQGCDEMRTSRQRAFSSEQEWQALVEAHSEPLFPREVWNKKWSVHGQAFIPLIRFCEQPVTVQKT